MKTIFKRASKSTLAVVLTLCLLFSCMTVGIMSTSAASVDYVDGWTQQAQKDVAAGAQAVYDASVGASAGESVGDDDKIIFVELSASWAVSGNILLHYWGGAKDGDASLSSYSGSIYKATIPSDSTGMKLHWNNGDWYGDDGDAAANNYAKLYESNGAKVEYGTHQVTSTASLTASKTSATTGENVTLTPGISSNTTYNAYKSVSYSISPSSGASISGNTFTATAAGTYTVTATVTYNAKGFTGITKTATATKNITVTAAATNYTVTYGTVTGYANGTATATVNSGSQVTSGTSVTFTATPTNANYQFVGWYGNASGTGSVVSSNASYTTTINATTTLYAKFVPVVQITAGSVTNGSLSIAYTKPNGTSGTLTSGSAYILSGSNVTVTATASTGYYVTKIGTSNVSGTYPSTGSKTYSSVTSAATYTATFASTPDITFYVCNDASWSQINYYIYTGNGGSTVGTAWPGEKITSTAIGTIDDKNVYQVTLPKANYPRSDAKCIILSNNGNNQYNGNGAVTLTDGYIYYTNDSDASEAAAYSASMLDAPSHNITFTPSPTGGTVTVGGSSTSPATARENNTYEIKATPSSGYYVSLIKVDSTSVYTGSMSSTGAKTANGTMGTSNQTVTVTFAKINYNLTKNTTSNGSFKLTNASGTEISTAQIGDTVKVVPTPATGYQTGTVARGTTSSLGTTISSNQFTMPASNQYVGVTFSEITGTVKGAAYTSGTASTTGGTVNNTSITVGIDTSKSITATKKSYYDFTGWQFSGNNCTHLRYRFGTSGEWLTPAAGTTYGTASNTTIYIKTDGTSGITTSNAEVHALFVPTTYSYTTNAKYSTTGANDSYTNTLSAGVTPASGSTTNPTGVTVTAPATVNVSGVKYNFVDFVATNGTVTTAAPSGTNKTTTFKPTAANAVCTARYKKVYNITSSVDNTGTGAGTVSTNVTEVVAGGSYTITATAKSGSAVESVKVNGTAKTNYSITGVSANQTVVVKFKSNVYLKGTMNSTAWAGDVMQANSAGTTYTIADVVLNAGTVYEFKHYVDPDVWSTTVATNGWNLSTFATHGTKDDGNGGANLTITPSVKVKVTFVSDGTKFTSITAVPYNSTQYNVTLTQSADYTITATYMSVEYTTSGKNANVTVPVYSGTEFSYTVTPASGKYLFDVAQSNSVALSPAFVVTTHASSYTGTISSVSKAFAVSATVANKLKVTCTTNKTEWGTVSVDKEYARPGETVTISYTAAAGVLKTLVAYNTTTSALVKSWSRDANGDMKFNQSNQGTVSLVFGKLRELVKVKAGESVGADDALTFTMPAGNVTITATYEEYSAPSDYYYYGYDTSGNVLSGYNGNRMTEGIINGEKFSYYEVSDRTGSDQLFKVATKASGTRRFYVETPGVQDWTGSDGMRNPYIYWFDDTWGTFEKLSYDKQLDGNGMGRKWWYTENIHEGVGCLIVNMNDTSNSGFKQTKDISADDVAYGGVWINSSMDGSKYNIGGRFSSTDLPSDAGTGATYYSWGDSVYATGTDSAAPYSFGTAGFNDHGQNYAKPKGSGYDSGSYYIVVLYPNKEYTINGVTKTTGNKIDVIWMKELPGQSSATSSYVKVYAKDGAVRRVGDNPKRNDLTYSYFEQHANTFVYSDSGYANHIGNRTSHDNQSSEGSTGYNGYTYDYIQKFEKGQTLYIKTNLDSTLTQHHYLVAYSINGKCYKLHDNSEGATVTEAFTVPEDWADTYVEITPIYFPKEASNCITFYIEGYDEEVMNAGWGNTPYVYPFYQDQSFNYVANINNAFGGYPGQPMVFYNGNYYTMLPKQYTTTPEGATTQLTCTIKGVTLGNGYWDDIHVLTGEVKSHFQTYDYDDLYKIYTEYGTDADHIICSFKYRTQYNNNEPASPNYSSFTNGWEVLTDYYGRPVDVFGNVLYDNGNNIPADIQAAIDDKNPTTRTEKALNLSGTVHAISQDYKSNSAGDYATEWAIYNTSGKKVVATSGGKTTIVPSALAIKATTSETDVAAGFDKYDSATRAFKSIYTVLYNDSNVRGKPVIITYEKSIYGGGDKADRCDARWYFSQKNMSITAKTMIEYSDDGKTWQTDTYTEGTGTGSYTGTKAYFTGKAATAVDTPSDTTGVSDTNTTSLAGSSGNGYYTFKAENHNGTNGNYEFVGWYLLRDNYQNISVRSSYPIDASQFASHAEQSKNGDIFVARFRKTATGTLDIHHEVHPQTSGYGSVTVSAVVNAGGQTYTVTNENSAYVKIPTTYIKSGEGNKVVATFTAAPYPTSNFDAFYATVQSLLEGYQDANYIDTIVIDDTNHTATVTYDVDKLFSMSSGSPVQTVTSITHYSKFSLKTNLTYNLTYEFKTRYYGKKLYKYTNKAFTAEELKSYFRSQIENPATETIALDEQFVQSKAPFESNFREDLTWVVDSVVISSVDGGTKNHGYLEATQVPVEWAKATVYDFQDNGSMKTTTMEAPLEKLFNKNVESKPTDASEATTAITNWSVDDSQLYAPLRTSYTASGSTVPLYLDHWEIYQLASFTYKTDSEGTAKMAADGYNLDIDTDKSKLVAISYGAHFNYIGYEDYAIVPVYNTERINGQQASDSRTDSSATLLTISRNHWNANTDGNTQGGTYMDGADRIYVDMMLNYNYSKNGQNILLRSTSENIKVGFILKSYTIENTGTGAIKTYSSKSQVVLVDKSQIDNKNRIEYCYGFKNSKNNSKWGLNFEFTPFIVDTNDQDNSVGQNVTIGGTNYKTLYANSTVSILDGVNFYRIGNYDPISWTEES